MPIDWNTANKSKTGVSYTKSVVLKLFGLRTCIHLKWTDDEYTEDGWLPRLGEGEKESEHLMGMPFPLGMKKMLWN